MRQVPQNLNSPIGSALLLIGSGRLAMHLARYFEFEKIAFSSWSQKSREKPSFAHADVVLLAISDSAIEGFLRDHQSELHGKICLHFSGALSVHGAWSFHPLMSFSREPYSHQTYRDIPFVLEEGAPGLEILGLKNKYSYLENLKRPLYHALCSMSGNFSVILWEYAAKRFEKDLGLKAEILRPYMHQISANIEQSLGQTPAQSVLTGPLVRRDFATIEKHLAALSDDPMKQVYEAFTAAYPKVYQEKK